MVIFELICELWDVGKWSGWDKVMQFEKFENEWIIIFGIMVDLLFFLIKK